MRVKVKKEIFTDHTLKLSEIIEFLRPNNVSFIFGKTTF